MSCSARSAREKRSGAIMMLMVFCYLAVAVLMAMLTGCSVKTVRIYLDEMQVINPGVVVDSLQLTIQMPSINASVPIMVPFNRLDGLGLDKKTLSKMVNYRISNNDILHISFEGESNGILTISDRSSEVVVEKDISRKQLQSLGWLNCESLRTMFAKELNGIENYHYIVDYQRSLILDTVFRIGDLEETILLNIINEPMDREGQCPVEYDDPNQPDY